MTDRPALWAIDIMGLAFRAIHAAPPLSSSAGIQTGGTYLFARLLLSFLNDRKPTHVVAVWDARSRSFRKDLSPTYKANRPPLDPAVKHQLKLARAVVRALPLPVLEVEGVEADDVLATLATIGPPAGYDVILMTSDKDLMACADLPGVTYYDPMKQIVVTPTMVFEKWGVPPRLISELLALTGDASDGVAGVPGIGPKTAAALLGRHGSLAEVVAHAGEVRGKRGEALRAAVADGTLDLARRLVTLRTDVPLPQGFADLALPLPDTEAREFLFRALEFTSLLPSDAMPTMAELNARTPRYDADGRKVT